MSTLEPGGVPARHLEVVQRLSDAVHLPKNVLTDACRQERRRPGHDVSEDRQCCRHTETVNSEHRIYLLTYKGCTTVAI